MSIFLPNPPNLILKQAVNGHAAGVALRIGRKDKTLYKMFENPEFCRYTKWLQVFIAIYDEHQPGAQLIVADFNARYQALEDRYLPCITDEAWYEQIALCEEEHSQGLQAAIRNRDARAIRRSWRKTSPPRKNYWQCSNGERVQSIFKFGSSANRKANNKKGLRFPNPKP